MGRPVRGTLVIGQNCKISNTVFGFYGDGGSIVFHDHVRINALPSSKAFIQVKDESGIFIEDDCLFSNGVDISTTDWHSVLDESGKRINPEKDIYIGRHVWVGRKAMIAKGVLIGCDSVVGAYSVVTRSFPEGHVVIAGNPAMVKKSIHDWKR